MRSFAIALLALVACNHPPGCPWWHACEYGPTPPPAETTGVYSEVDGRSVAANYVGDLPGGMRALWIGSATPSASNWTLSSAGCDFHIRSQAPRDGGKPEIVRDYYRCDATFRQCFEACAHVDTIWVPASDEEKTLWTGHVAVCADGCQSLVEENNR